MKLAYLLLYSHYDANGGAEMKIKTTKTNICSIATVVAIIFFLPVCWAAEVTIIGEVNDMRQIVADKQIYEVDENALGDELVYDYISEKVKVTGIITERDDMKIITVTSFEVVPE
jgi:hypothetical protein